VDIVRPAVSYVRRGLGVGGLALLASLSITLPVAAAGPETCLAGGDIQEATDQGKVIEPKAAILTARRLVPGADVMRGGLCREGDVLIYRFMVLGKDGRLIHVTIDGPSGKVLRVVPP
jgi:uncharacterized membrane protein YkoI